MNQIEQLVQIVGDVYAVNDFKGYLASSSERFRSVMSSMVPS